MKNKKINSKSILKAALSLLLPLLFLLAAGKLGGFVFEANDDRFISEILSGVFYNTPSVHAVFLLPWVSFPIMLLYRIAPGISWWGGFLIAVFYCSNVLILYSGLDFCDRKAAETEEKSDKAPSWILPYASVLLGSLALCLAAFYFASQVQFTSAAIVAAAAGYAVYILNAEKKSSVVIFFLAELVSYSIRADGMLLVQPFGMLLLFGILLTEKKHFLKKLLPAVIAVLAVLLAGLLGKAVSGEYSAEYRSFDTFNKMRAAFYDYDGTPPYEDVQSILDRYGVSKEEWNAFASGYIADWPMNDGLNGDLLDYAKANTENGKISLIPPLAKSWLLFPVLAGAAAFAAILLSKKYLYLVSFGGIILSHCVAWGYLSYKGRMVPRVCCPLLWAECTLFLVLMWYIILSSAKKSLFIIKAVLTSLLLAGALLSGFKQYQTVKGRYETQEILQESLAQIEEYCDSHTENRYLFDPFSVTASNGLALENRRTGQPNYRNLGTWVAATPEFREDFAKYMEKGGALYYVTPDFGEDNLRIDSDLGAHLKSLYGENAELADTVAVSTGGNYLIYRITE